MNRLLPLCLIAVCVAGCKPADGPAPATATKEAEPAPAIARITAKAATAAGITLAEAGSATIAATLPLYGVVKPNAERAREVIARFPGTVRSVSKSVGDAVRAGEVLATVESNESLQTYAITAPIAGVVVAREADPGEQTGADVLFRIADPTSCWVELSLFPADVAKVHVGQAVQIASVDGGLKAEARISLVGSYGESGPSARITLADPAQRWTLGLYVNGLVELARGVAPVVVAATAIQRLDEREVVFVPVAGGYAPRTVRRGRADAQSVEILEGLKPGEPYVASGSFVVKAELGKRRLEEQDDDEPAPAAATQDGTAAKHDDD